MTFGLGQEVFERFGHNAIWMHDAANGTDVAYDWGKFSFRQPRFLRRFLTGDTRYWMEAKDANVMIELYRALGRPITLQRLNLTPEQKLNLRDFLRWNALEETTLLPVRLLPRQLLDAPARRARSRARRCAARGDGHDPHAVQLPARERAAHRRRPSDPDRDRHRARPPGRRATDDVGVVLHPDAAARRDPRRDRAERSGRRAGAARAEERALAPFRGRRSCPSADGAAARLAAARRRRRARRDRWRPSASWR